MTARLAPAPAPPRSSAAPPQARTTARLAPARTATRLAPPRTRALPLLFAAALAAPLWACIPSEETTLRAGDPAPDFTATSLADGAPVALSDYLGQTLLVNLWATWCHPCRTETPYLQSVYERYRDRGLRILGVSIDLPADSAAVVHFVEEFGVTYDIALDPDAVSREIFHARGLPTSVLIDPRGAVAFSWIGPIPEGDPTFVGGLEAVLEAREQAPRANEGVEAPR